MGPGQDERGGRVVPCGCNQFVVPGKTGGDTADRLNDEDKREGEAATRRRGVAFSGRRRPDVLRSLSRAPRSPTRLAPPLSNDEANDPTSLCPFAGWRGHSLSPLSHIVRLRRHAQGESKRDWGQAQAL